MISSASSSEESSCVSLSSTFSVSTDSTEDSAVWMDNYINKELFLQLETQTSDQMSLHKRLSEESEKRVDLMTKYVEEEIEIRIESMKCQLDGLHEAYKSELAIKNEEAKKNIRKAFINSDLDENDVTELKLMIENSSYNSHAYQFYRERLKNLKTFNEKLQDLQIAFNVSTESINKNFIGEIVYKNPLDDLNTINQNDCDMIKLNLKLRDACLLSSNRIVATTGTSLLLFDRNFNILKRIDAKISNQSSYYAVSVCNKRNELYVIDLHAHCILKFDASLNLLKTFGSKGSGEYELSHPNCIFCKDDYLYVSDSGNLRIQIITADSFEYIYSINLNFNPFSVKVSNTIAIYGNDELNFYDLNDRSFIRKYRNVRGALSEMHSSFILFTFAPNAAIRVYKSDGTYVNELCMEKWKKYINYYTDGRILSTDENVYIISYSKKFIIKLKKVVV